MQDTRPFLNLLVLQEGRQAVVQLLWTQMLTTTCRTRLSPLLRLRFLPVKWGSSHPGPTEEQKQRI